MLHPIQHQDTTNQNHTIHLLQHMDILNPLMDTQNQLMGIQSQPMELQSRNTDIQSLDMDHQSHTFQKNQFYWPKDHMK